MMKMQPMTARAVREATLLLFLLAVALPMSARGAAALFAKGPYLQSPGSNAMTLVWESPTNHPGRVHFGLGRTPDQKLEVVLPRRMKGVSTTSKTNLVTTKTNGVSVTKTNITSTSKTNVFYLYEATLRDLKAGATYSYSVELAGRRTSRRQFRTLAAEAEKVQFIVYGDSRSNPKQHAAVVQRFRKHARRGNLC
jgi:hypothetical protein